VTSSSPGEPPVLPPPPAPRWELRPPPSPDDVQLLAQELSLPGPLCDLLAVRGRTDPEEAKAFLRPLLAHLHPPELLKDAPEAAQRIMQAIAGAETILVHGDYDVDGICAATLLTDVIRAAGGVAEPFVPHRLRDGYDLGAGGLARAREVGATLLITVDCGIVAHEAVAEARAAGMDVIVTDHHTPGDTLPDALAVVNPNRDDCDYPDPDLCGAGVAFKVAQLVARAGKLPDPELTHSLDLVALATVADLVPLTGENRVLVRYGLRVLEETRRPGLRALMKGAGLLDGGALTAGRIGFTLAPRINAAGRVGETRDALDLLLTEDPARAQELAASLEGENRRRQAEDKRTLQEALEVVAREYDAERDRAVVVAGEGWHPGVIGIVASRVVERVHRPTVLLALDGDSARGSARSIPGFHLYDALAACSGLLERFGGHKAAAGMDVARENLEEFRDAFLAEAARRLPPDEELTPLLTADLELRMGDVSAELVRFLQYAGPFGMANRRPVFLTRGIRAEGVREVGTGHLKLRLRDGRSAVDGIGFGLVSRFPPADTEGAMVDAIYHLEENHYRGRVSVQARILDLRIAREEP